MNVLYDTIRYDTIGEFNVDWKAEYSALSSTRSQKKKLKQPTPVPLYQRLLYSLRLLYCISKTLKRVARPRVQPILAASFCP